MNDSRIRCLLISILSIFCIANMAGAQAWKPYNFQGNEHFKYAIKSLQEGEEKSGFFTLDLEKKGEDKFKVSFSSSLGENEASSSTTATADELAGKIIMSLMMSGSEAGAVLGATLFTPMLGMMFMGMGPADLEVGSGWSRTEEGKKISFKVEAKEKIAGHEGYRCVFREGDNLKYMQVIAPDIGLPLKTEVANEDGSHFSSELVELKK